MLLVGESAPFSGRTFFYDGNSRLYRHWEWAFTMATGRQYSSPRLFLEWLQSSGIFLDDLLTGHIPVDRKARRKLWPSGVMPLADRLTRYRPEMVVTVMRGIGEHVTEAIHHAGIRTEHRIVTFPFPGSHYKRAKAEALEVAQEIATSVFSRDPA